MRGRKPKPTALIQLQGTGNATRMKRRVGEPKATGTLDKAPDWFTESQREGWDYAIKHAPAGVLHAIDRAVLTVWVEAEDRHRIATITQARLDVNNSLPLLFKAKDGPPIASAYVSIITKAALVMMKAGSDLGFSPAARPRLAQQVGDVAAKTSEWAKLKLINGGKGVA
jgi:P27 family predicted phage terminase small subunit